MPGIRRKGDLWTENELRILRAHYKARPAAALLELLPFRSVTAIREKARQLGLRRYWMGAKP